MNELNSAIAAGRHTANPCHSERPLSQTALIRLDCLEFYDGLPGMSHDCEGLAEASNAGWLASSHWNSNWMLSRWYIGSEKRTQALIEMDGIQEQIVWHETACMRDQLKVQPEGLVVTPTHVRAGFKWFSGRFSSEIRVSREEATVLLNASAEDLAQFLNQLNSPQPIRVPSEVVVRLSFLLGIYGAIARIAPDGQSRFIYLAFREARQLFYNEQTLMEYLLHSTSIERWYSVRAHLRSLEAGFIG